MTYQQKDLSGSLFVNDRKEQENHPDYRGDCTISGVAFWMSGWKKKTKDGQTWLSLSFKEKEAKQAKPAPKPAPRSRHHPDPGAYAGSGFDGEDDIPF